MVMSVQTNIFSVNANRNLGGSQVKLQKTMSRLSSGLRIARAADDAAGLAISEKMRSQIRSLNQASRNAQDGISMIQTAEGALGEVSNMLHRFRELAIQAANDTYVDSDRSKVVDELNQLKEEINNISSRTQFNGRSLLDGSLTAGGSVGPAVFQIGANTTADNTVTTEFGGATTALMDDGTISAGTLTNGQPATLDNALDQVDPGTPPPDPPTNANYQGGSAPFLELVQRVDIALSSLNSHRATLGAAQNRLEYAMTNVDNVAENLTASESRIRDADVAKETAELAKNNIMIQAGVSVLSQANQLPQSALKLLG